MMVYPDNYKIFTVLTRIHVEDPALAREIRRRIRKIYKSLKNTPIIQVKPISVAANFE